MDAQPGSSSIRHSALPLAPAQVIALGLVAASIGWAVWLLRDRPASEEVELLAGMVLPSSEMAIMEAAFDRAQLGDHRTEGGRVWVPRSRQSAYMRALVDAEALPREFGGSLRRALEKNSPWQSRAVQDELLRVATQEELSLVICSMPGIERAAVLYDTEARGGFDGTHHGQPAKTASVNVRTQPDTELDPARVQAIRVLVSSSIAGLKPERVAVTDLRSGRVHAGPLDADADRDSAAAAADPALARRIAHERHLAAKVRQALSFIKGVAVDVTVEFPGPESDTPPVPPAPGVLDARGAVPLQRAADANAPAELQLAVPIATAPPVAAPRVSSEPTDAAPDCILVSIAVPETYFQAACRAAAERAGQPLLQPLAIETQETERIRQHVLALLPATRDPARRRVVVTGFPIAGTFTGRRDQPSRTAHASVEGDARVQAAAVSLAEVVALVAAGRFDEVPRQIWLAAMSVTVGLLAALMWMLGGRVDPGDGARHRRGPQPRIDWSAAGPYDAGDAAEDDQVIPSAHLRGRAAALLLCLTCGFGTARAADADPVPPAPEPVLAESAAPPQPETSVRTVEAVPPRAATPGQAPQVLPALPLDGSRASVAGEPVAAAPRIGDWKLLAVIVAAFAAVGVASRLSRRRTAMLPPDVFEVLGTAPLAGQHAVRIVRFGPKTLLVGVSAGGCHTLAELSDPQATACIAAACRGSHPPLRPATRNGQRSTATEPPRTGREAA